MNTYYIKISGLTRQQIEAMVETIECCENVDCVEILAEDEIIRVEDLEDKQAEDELTQFYRHRDL